MLLPKEVVDADAVRAGDEIALKDGRLGESWGGCDHKSDRDDECAHTGLSVGRRHSALKKGRIVAWHSAIVTDCVATPRYVH